MAEFLRLAKELVEKGEAVILNSADSPLLNKVQCTRLWQSLTAVYHRVFEPGSVGSFKQRYFPLYKEFYIIVLRADAILRKCSREESWLEAAIFYGDNRQAFQELSLQLQLCVESFHKLTEALSPASGIRRLSSFLSIAVRDDVADEDFRADAQHLMARLNEADDQAMSETERLLTDYLRKREESRVVLSSKPLHHDHHALPGFYRVSRKHHIVKSIGSGAIGVVVSEVEWLGLRCAQKEFTKGVPQAGFLKEVGALVALNHPRIVKLLSYCDDDSAHPHTSLVMELMPMSLLDYIENAGQERQKSSAMPFTIDAAVDMMLQIAQGIQYLHGQGVVHRDLKSPNILVAASADPRLSSEGYVEVKLTDFGLAKMKVYDKVTPTGKMLGSTLWIAPEVTAPIGNQRIDWRKADVYSFGITCSEILTGNVPYSEEPKQTKILEKVKGGLRPKLPADCPVYLSEFLKRCWAEKARARPSSEEIVDTLTGFKACLMICTKPEHAPWKARRLFESVWDVTVGIAKKVVMVESPDHHPETEKARFGATTEIISHSLETAHDICTAMKERITLLEVEVCHVQCDYLVREYSEGVRKVKSLYERISPCDLLELFRSCKLQQFIGPLDRLMGSTFAAQELLRSCCRGGNWRMAALAITAPQAPSSCASCYSSWFGGRLWELHWNLYVIHHVMDVAESRRPKTSPQLLVTSSNLRMQWCKARCRLTLVRRSFDTDCELKGHEFLESDALEADADRLAQDRRDLLARLNEEKSGDSPLFEDIGFAPFLKKRLSLQSSSLDFGSHEDSYWMDHILTCDVLAGDGKVLDRGLRSNSGSITHTRLGQLWMFGDAAVVMKSTSIRSTRSRARLCTEVETLARVQHPNVVHLIGYAHSRDEMLVFMESMQDDLQRLIERNSRVYTPPFPLLVAIDILLQIAEAMICLHERGVLHRRLSPDNILVAPKYHTTKSCDHVDVYYTVKLTGFEESCFYTTSSSEIWSNTELDSSYTLSEDVRSFGRTAHMVVTGLKLEDSVLSRRRSSLSLHRRRSQILPGLEGPYPQGLKELIARCCHGSHSFTPHAAQPAPSFEEIRKELWSLKYKEEVH